MSEPEFDGEPFTVRAVRQPGPPNGGASKVAIIREDTGAVLWQVMPLLIVGLSDALERHREPRFVGRRLKSGAYAVAWGEPLAEGEGT